MLTFAQISILICSHSQANDLWPITDHFLRKHWKDCPYPIYLGANGIDKKHECPVSWIYLNQGDDITWAQSMMSYLEAIPTQYVFLWLDDFVLLENVQVSIINIIENFITNHSPMMVRLTPNPTGDIAFNTLFDKIDVWNRVPYVTSLQMSLWNKEFLIMLLQYGFSPWDFENKAGKVRESMEYKDHFYVANKPLIHYTHYVEKGKFYPFIHELLSKENLEFNSSRFTLSSKELKIMRRTRWYTSILLKISPKYINFIRKILGKHEL